MEYLMEMVVDSLDRRKARERGLLCRKPKQSVPSTNKISKIQSKVCSMQWIDACLNVDKSFDSLCGV